MIGRDALPFGANLSERRGEKQASMNVMDACSQAPNSNRDGQDEQDKEKAMN
jgi:hypothetical protein